MGYIYYIKNLITNKYYVGQTINDLKERWRNHRKKNSNCVYLKNAFKKYGFDNFEFKLICICFDDDLNKFEIDYIKHFNSLVPDGYNLKKGGLGGGKLHQETKDKISKTTKTMYINGYQNPNKVPEVQSLGLCAVESSRTGKKSVNNSVSQAEGREL